MSISSNTAVYTNPLKTHSDTYYRLTIFAYLNLFHCFQSKLLGLITVAPRTQINLSKVAPA